jgi:hypothetical protein
MFRAAYLMMSGMLFETCWALNKFWNNKFYNKIAFCWLFLLIHTFNIVLIKNVHLVG